MFAIAGCYFVAGILVGAWVLHEFSHKPPQSSAEAAVPNPTVSGAPLGPNPVSSFTSGLLHYDLAVAVRPDPNLTPGDVLPDATAEDVCIREWATDHRHVTEEVKEKVYLEYGRTKGPGCCEVDHLIPLELGGSNEIKNLWPQPEDLRPGDAEKDQLENELHRLVCSGKMSLGEAQKCIASNWVNCWVRYVLPSYGPEWAEANRHGW